MQTILPKPCGGFLEVDDQGHILRRASVELIQEEWKPLVEAVTPLYVSSYGSNLHSVWLRGSVAKGEAQPGCSDLDTYAFIHEETPWPASMTEGEAELTRRFPFCQGLELSARLLSSLENNRVDERILKTQSICLHGEDIRDQIAPFKLQDMIHYSRYLRFHLDVKLPRFLESDAGDETEIKATCGWVTRLLLRSLYELTILDEGRWTNDLWPCYEVFSTHYPEREDAVMRLLVLALNPVGDEEQLRSVIAAFVPWIYGELTKRLGVESDLSY